VGRLVRYKRFDAVIEAFNQLGRRLVICGTGPDRFRLETLAGPSVRFAGHVPDTDLIDLYSTARAVVIPGEEDWGMIGLEANACGCPAVAAAWGGSVESVRDGISGILYDPQQRDGLVEAIGRLESTSFDPLVLRDHAGKYGEEQFRDSVSQLVNPMLSGA
jgi:glycosyltransferase involved in cell wall biosynthesis